MCSRYSPNFTLFRSPCLIPFPINICDLSDLSGGPVICIPFNLRIRRVRLKRRRLMWTKLILRPNEGNCTYHVPDLDIDFQIAAANKWECSQRVSWRYAEADRHTLTQNPALSTICGTGRHLDGKPPSPPRICVVSGQW